MRKRFLRNYVSVRFKNKVNYKVDQDVDDILAAVQNSSNVECGRKI